MTNFDAELLCQRHDKFMLDVDMKNAELRFVTQICPQVIMVIMVINILQIKIQINQIKNHDSHDFPLKIRKILRKKFQSMLQY